MKIRSLIVATLVLVALAGTLYWSEHRKPAAETAQASADTPPTILKLDETAITRIEFKKKDAEPIVLEKNNSGWQITKPTPLRADQVAETRAQARICGKRLAAAWKPSAKVGVSPLKRTIAQLTRAALQNTITK